MSVLEDAGAAVLVQGLTGRVGRRHATHMRDYGTSIVAGVVPGRGGSSVDGVPVFDTVAAAVDATGARTAIGFLPAASVRDGICEAADAGLELYVSVTEGVRQHDVLAGLERADESGMRVIGPNCPGLMSAGRYLLGVLPVEQARAGGSAVLSRSGTLSYEAVLALARAIIGVSLWIGIGGDRVKGSTFADLIPDVVEDPRTEAIVLIGEIGGTDEEDAAPLIAEAGLPAVALIAGASAPEGVSLGHAGAIVEGGRGTHAAKREALEAAGVTVVTRPSEIPPAVAALVGGSEHRGGSGHG